MIKHARSVGAFVGDHVSPPAVGPFVAGAKVGAHVSPVANGATVAFAGGERLVGTHRVASQSNKLSH